MTSKTVLYAEDDFANRKLMELQLTKKGISCDCVENGRQALEFFRSRAYRLVILDQNMPEKTGSEVVKEIRLTDRSIPVIALTSDDSDIDNLMRCGFTEVMIKPILDNSLFDRINELIAGS